MKRILVAVGALTAVLGVGLVVTLVGTSPSEPAPPSTSSDVTRPLDTDELARQTDQQARHLKAAQDQLAQAVDDEAARLRTDQ